MHSCNWGSHCAKFDSYRFMAGDGQTDTQTTWSGLCWPFQNIYNFENRNGLLIIQYNLHKKVSLPTNIYMPIKVQHVYITVKAVWSPNKNWLPGNIKESTSCSHVGQETGTGVRECMCVCMCVCVCVCVWPGTIMSSAKYIYMFNILSHLFVSFWSVL